MANGRPYSPLATPYSPFFSSLHPVFRPFVGDIGADRLGGRHVRIGAGGIALLLLDDAAPVERRDELGVERERLVVVGERGVEVAELEIDQRAAVDRVGGV